MNEFYGCDACAEAYDEGGVLCPHHDQIVLEEVKAHGQPPSLGEQHSRMRDGRCLS